MKSINISGVTRLILRFKIEIENHSNKAQNQLKNLIDRELTENDEIQYARLLIKKSEEIILAHPNELVELGKRFDKIIGNELMETKEKENFRKKIITCLGYSELRSNFYPKYFGKLGIKACVYCNAQSTLSITRSKLKPALPPVIQGKFQVDHYMPKNNYPCFSISLFNLYPVCASCNNIKGTKKIDFLLYTNTTNKPYLEFELNKESHGKYLISRDIDDIKIEIKPLIIKPPKGYSDIIKLFEIGGIYEQYKDIAEELILKAEIYTPAYKNALLNSFSNYLKPEKIDRLIIGNYTLEDEIHKRPLSKFMLDISKNIGLLK